MHSRTYKQVKQAQQRATYDTLKVVSITCIVITCYIIGAFLDSAL